jgi:autotransporter-associated beta strand protein
MGRRTLLAIAAATAGPMFFSPNWAQAQVSLTWDNNADVAPNPQDGTGTWDTTALDFFDGTNHAWNNANNDTAVFSGATAAGGNVVIQAPIVAGGIVVNRSGYSFVGASATTTNNLTFGGATPTFTATASTSINVPVAGSSAITFNISPTATLSLQGFASITNTGGEILMGGGTFAIGNATGGTLSNGAGTLSGATLTVGNTRTLSNNFFVTANTTNAVISASGGNATVSGSFAGTGTVALGAVNAGSIETITGNNTTFAGTFTFPTGGIIRLTSATNGFEAPLATFDLSSTNTGRIVTTQTGATYQLGALASTGGGFLQGANAGSTAVTYEIGGANIDSTYAGQILDGTNDSAFLTVVHSRQTAIRKIGSKTLTLSGTTPATAAYTGNTTINGGTIALTRPDPVAGTNSIAVNNAGSGNFDVTQIAGGYTVPAAQTISGNGGTIWGTVNISNPTGTVNPGINSSGNNSGVGVTGALTFHDTLNLNGGSLNFDLTSGGSDLLTVGSLEISAASKLSISPTATGMFTLVNYTGENGSLSNLSLTSSTNVSAQLITSTPGVIQVNVLSLNPTSNLRWNGPGTAWDVNNSQNFINTSTSAAAAFFQGDNVTFDDTVGVPTTISINQQVTPTSVTFTNNTNAFFFSSGGGSITGSTSVVMNGTGSISFSNANGYTGGTSINTGGTVHVSNAGALGSGTIVLNGGTLSIDSTITLGGGTISVIASNSTITGNGSFNNVLLGDNTHALNLAIATGNTLSVSSLNFSADAAGAGAAPTISMGNSGGTFRITGTGSLTSNSFFDLGTGSAILMTRDGNNNLFAGLAGGPLTTLRGAGSASAASTFNFGTGGAPNPPTGVSTFAGTILNGSGGSGATLNLIKNGFSWTLSLTGTNTYTGVTQINQGTLLVNGTHNGGGTYTVAGDPLGLGLAATLAGTGQISATINLSGNLLPGGGGTVGAFTAGTLLTQSGSSIQFDVGGGNADELILTGSSGLNLSAGGPNIGVSDIGGSTYGRYVLIDYNGTALTDLNGFSPNSGFTVNGVSSSLVNNTLNTSVDLYVPNPNEHDSTWSAGTSRQWQTGVTGNWNSGPVPGNADDVAIFTDTAAGAVTLANPETVALVNFNTTTGSYNIGGTSTLTLDASGGYVGVNVQGGNQTISAPVVIGKSAIVAVNTSSSLTVTNAISGANSLTKSGAGTLTLSGVNTYSGATTLNGGELVVNDSTGLGDASSTNVLNLAGGTLKVLSAFTSPATRAINMQASTTLDTTGNTVEFDGALNGSGTLTDTGAGTLILTGNNGFTGAVKINSGTLDVASTNNLGNAGSGNRLVFNGGAMLLTGTYSSGRSVLLSQTGTIDTNGNVGTISGTISSSGGLVKQGAGTLQLTVANTYTGLTTVTGGALGIASDAALGGGNGVATVTTSSTGSNTATLTAIPAGLAVGSNFLGTTVTAIDTTSNIVTLAANASTNLSSGTASFSTAFPVTVDGGALVAIGAVTLSESNSTGVASSMIRNVTVGSNGGTFSAGSSAMAIPGVISGPGSVSKGGSGTVTFSGSNTYAGFTRVNTGTLILSGSNSWSGTALTTATPTATNGTIVNGGRLVFDFTGNAAADPGATVQSALTAGFNLPSRFSAGLIRTENAADNLHGLGWTDNGTSKVTVAYTYYGDSDLSGTVDIADFNTLASNFATTGATWQKGDFNYDGVVNLLDLNAIATNFGATPALDVLPSSAPLGTLVPEPASLGILALGAGAMLRRRRK